MKHGIRVTRENIHLLAKDVDVSSAELYNDMVDAQIDFRREQKKRWAYEFFGKDEQWHDDTMQKVKEIRESLPENINGYEAAIKQYGWITKNGKKNLIMPMMTHQDYPEYAHAVTVEYILTDPDKYHRAMNWD